MHMISKSEAHYRIGHADSHCGRVFEGDKNTCRHLFRQCHPPPNSGNASGLLARSIKFIGVDYLLGRTTDTTLEGPGVDRGILR